MQVNTLRLGQNHFVDSVDHAVSSGHISDNYLGFAYALVGDR